MNFAKNSVEPMSDLFVDRHFKLQDVIQFFQFSNGSLK